MEIFKETGFIIACMNVVNTLGNIYWSWRLKAREADHDMNDLVKRLHKEKNTYKMQYQSVYSKLVKVQGELETYKKLHNH